MVPVAATAPVAKRVMPAIVPAPVVVETVAAVEVIEDVKAEAARVQPEVIATVQQEAPAAAAIVETVKAEIAAEPAPAVIESIETPMPVVGAAVEAVAETPVVAAVRNEPVQIDLVDAVNEATADAETPSEAAAPTPASPAPKPASAPSTGSLFFVADVDTPPSVTRSLFEPVTPAKPADIPADDKQDDTTSEERSA